MADIIDLNDREFEKAAAEGDEGVLAILKHILQELTDIKANNILVAEALKNTNEVLTLLTRGK
jgi:hypothetical protein